MQERRSDICIFIISPRWAGLAGREGGQKGGEERFKEVENNRLRFAPCVFALVHLIILLVIIMVEW